MNRVMDKDLAEFECQRCGNCCRRHGIVRLTNAEAETVAEFLHMDIYAFTEKYTELLPDRSALTLTELENGDCIFFDGDSGCRINPVKPKQCRDFPYVWRFENWTEVCAGARKMLNGKGRSQ